MKKTIAFAEYEKKHPSEKRASLSARSDSVKRSRSGDLEPAAAANNSAMDTLDGSQNAAPENEEATAKENTVQPIHRRRSPSPAKAADTSMTKRVRRTDSSPRMLKAAREIDIKQEIGAATQISAYEAAAMPPSPTLTAASTDMPVLKEAAPINPLIDISKVAATQPDKSLVPECVLAVFPHKKSNGMYCLMEWKNAEGHVQFLDAEYVREHYPQMLIDFFIAERTAKAL